MGIPLVAIAVHVVMGATWVLATLGVAATGWARPLWLKLMFGVAVVNMAAGVYLWHALHRGPWGPTERLLVLGTFSAFVALGIQIPIALTMPSDACRLETPALWVFRITALFLIGAATAMVASKI